MEEIIEILVKSGMTVSESENLIALFLEENAEDYIKIKEAIH